MAQSVADLTTPADGTWTTTVPDGTYRIGFSRTGYLDQWYSGAAVVANATPVVVSGSNRTGLNAALALGATISGTVTGPAGAIEDGFVTVYREVAPGDFEDVAYASTGATGGYTVTGLPPGSYVVELDADGHVTEYWNDKATLAAADRITATVGSTTTANALLAAARKLSGTVTGPTGAPVADADVTVEARYDDGEGGFYWDYYTDATTSATGAWTADVAAGDLPGELPEERLHHRVVEQRGHGGRRNVRGGDHRRRGGDQRPAVPRPRSSRAGCPDRTDRCRAEVTVYPASATDLGTASVLASDFTSSDGDYVVDTLPPGSYKIRFEASRLHPGVPPRQARPGVRHGGRALDGRAGDGGRDPGARQGDHGHRDRRRRRHRGRRA